MTLVLPYCSDQTENRLFFEPLRSKMPCVYDGEPLDFESALMSGEWPTLKDIASEYEQNDDSGVSTKATPMSGDRSPSKRKLGSEVNNDERGATEAKKPCTDIYLNSSFSEVSNDSHSSPSSTVSLSCSTQEAPAADDDDDQYLPRRRGPQMWNSRQRWKDERKKVLKMSVSKLTDIDDPEMWLLRSVLINNTIKKLHQDIRNERQAKMRHRQQKIDFFQDRYEPASSSGFDASSTNSYESKKSQSSSATPSDMYDETSCDEIFGISEDFLRVSIPDRRMSSSPIPTNAVQDTGHNDKDSAMEVDPSPSSSDCDMRSDQTHSSPISFTTRTQTNELNSASQPRHVASGSSITNGGSQCATQFRTNDGSGVCCGGDTTFPPRVPILDSVVYHSLLASLESS